MLKKLLKIIAILLVIVLLAVAGYVAYVLISYHRLPDTDETVNLPGEGVRAGEEYTVAAWNLGFGAYSSDYSFFMDGGTESRARSAEAVRQNLGHAFKLLKELNPDFMLLQEMDTDSTRAWHINEVELAREALADWQSLFAQNYDSPYLFYPITQPHGASKAGILTLTKRAVERFVRTGLPVEKGLTKLLDLDRCYSKAWVPMENGKYLVLYNLHLSAYTSDGNIATEQLKLLAADMLSEYEAGNYAVAGGDFNKDLLGNSPEVFGVSGKGYTWAQPLPEGAIPEGLTLADSLDPNAPVPSCRNADAPYTPGKTFVLTADGFLVSDNVKAVECHVIDEGFAVSDHNPVVLTFELAEA